MTAKFKGRAKKKKLKVCCKITRKNVFNTFGIVPPITKGFWIHTGAERLLLSERPFRAAFEPGSHEWFVRRRLITKLEMLHLPGFLKFCFSWNLTSGKKRRKKWTTGRLVREKLCFEGFQRYANSRWLTAGFRHNISSMWPDNVLAVSVISVFISARVYFLNQLVRALKRTRNTKCDIYIYPFCSCQL